ncbi:MAG: hypothetical protein QNJ47_08660 [Nostocaceae cyanobacterium]|nr:hypothetical protein [Nostocaceae cyanobacterium]
MANLEQLLEELPNLVENLNLNIGDADEINQEASRLNNIAAKLQNIQELIEDELGFEKVKNAAMSALPFLGTVASIFIPGGFLVDAVIAGGAGFIAEKFGDTEAEIILQDLQSRIEVWIEWCNELKEISQEILNNTQLLSYIKFSQLKASGLSH